MQFGVASARRGWLTAADVLNTRPLDGAPTSCSRRGAPSMISLGRTSGKRGKVGASCGLWVRRCGRRVWTKVSRWPTRRAIRASVGAISRRSRPKIWPLCRHPSTPAASCAPTPSTWASTPRPWSTCISRPRATSRPRRCARPCRTSRCRAASPATSPVWPRRHSCSCSCSGLPGTGTRMSSTP